MKQSLLRLTNQTLLVCFSIIYPFGLVFKSKYLVFILLCLALFWALKGYFDKKALYLLVSAFFIFVAFMRDFAFFYPVIVNLFMLFVFGSTLFQKESLITKLAKAQNPNLPPKGIKYTRNLTKIWSLFFFINAILSFALFFVDEKFWAFYCGVLSYILVGALFFGEILFRKVFIKGV
ncbi:Uncharacterised protein [Campylobacter ureolyticus]|uniref:DNA gyrase subunit B n=2 Tax=Campylobacter ureolyticus TaxID=827 RepID=A0A6N2THE8_9BACT